MIGAGPIGLYTAYRLVKSGHCVVVWEKGVVAGNVAKWEHVTLFSALSLNLPADARADLEAGWYGHTPLGHAASEHIHDQLGKPLRYG